VKILVLRFSSIGDIVLTSPVLRCLRQQTGAELHFLTKKAFAGIVEANPYVQRVWTFERDVDEVLPALRAEHFDHIVDLHHNLRSLRLKLTLRRPATSFPKLTVQKWLLVRTGLDFLPDRHIVYRYMDAVKPLGVQYDGQGLDYFIPEREQIDIQSISSQLFENQYIAFAIGATHATKRLPTERIIALCKRTNHTIALLGGKAEGEAAAQISLALGPKVVNLCGTLTLAQSAQVVQQASVVITHDTGMMHIAAAFRKRIISIWGSTVPAFGMYPFYPDGINSNTSVEVEGLSCRPCSKIGHSKCPKGHFNCMQMIDLAAFDPIR
jgi:ADP-heptose:LPS heptosyltransferase